MQWSLIEHTIVKLGPLLVASQSLFWYVDSVLDGLFVLVQQYLEQVEKKTLIMTQITRW